MNIQPAGKANIYTYFAHIISQDSVITKAQLDLTKYDYNLFDRGVVAICNFLKFNDKIQW